LSSGSCAQGERHSFIGLSVLAGASVPAGLFKAPLLSGTRREGEARDALLEVRTAELATSVGASTQRRDTARSSPFVGREREIAELRAGLDDALAGHGRLFLISGEPGIGKTRLAEQLSSQASERSVRVLWGRCWEGGGAPAYWPIVQILRGCGERHDFAQSVETLGDGITSVASLVPKLVPTAAREPSARAEGGDPEQARFRLFDAVASLIRGLADREPMVLVIDDLHDAGTAAVQMLSFLARALKDARVLIVGTHREAEVERSPELRSAIAQLARAGNQLPLGGLNQTDAAELVRARAGFVPDQQFLETLHRTTEGNPLFLNGVVQMLAAEGRLEGQEPLTAEALKLPTNVRGAIHSRLQAMSSQTTAIISVAAALGIEFNTVLLERAAPAGSGEVLRGMDEATALGIIATVLGSPTSFRFTHSLVRAAVYEAIGTAERSRLHRQIGEALEAVYSGDPHAHLAEIANHFRLALPVGSAEKAINYSIRASEAARAVYAYEEAIAQDEAALALMKQHGGDPGERACLLGRLSDSNFLIGQGKLEQVEAAIAAYDELNLPFEAAEMRVQLCQVLLQQGPRLNASQALLLLRKAEAVLSQGPPNKWLSRVYFNLGTIANDRYLIRQALEAYTRAMQVGERLGFCEPWCSSAAMVALVQSACYGRIGEARVLLDRVWEKLPAMQLPILLWCTALYAGGCHEVLMDFRSAQEWLTTGLARPLPSKSHIDLIRFRLGACSCWLGDLAAMRQHLAGWQQFSTSLRAQAEFLLAWTDGDFERCRKLSQAGVESKKFKESGHWDQHRLQLTLAMTLRHDGDYVRAEEILLSALAPCESDEMFLYREMAFRPEHALNLATLGDLERAQAEISRCSEILAASEDWRGLAGHFHSAAGYCSAATGAQPESEQHFAAAIETFERLSLPWSEADTFQLWGQALVAARQPRSANEKFDAAIEIYRRIGGGVRWIERVETVRRAQSTPRPLPGDSIVQQEQAKNEDCFAVKATSGRSLMRTKHYV